MKRKLKILSLFLFLSVKISFAQEAANKPLLYPSCDTLKSSPLQSCIHYITTGRTETDSGFACTQGLEWLEEIAGSASIVLIGENHYFRYNAQLAERIFFGLNRYNYFPVIILEDRFSKTPFANRYLTIQNDADAQTYFLKHLSGSILTIEEKELLIRIRQWNLLNPGKKLQVLYSDLEHDFRGAFRDLLIPFFSSIDTSFHLQADTLGMNHIEALTGQMKQLLSKCADSLVRNEAPFPGTKTVEKVLTNLEQTFFAYHAMYKSGYGAFREIRSRSVINTLRESFSEMCPEHRKAVLYGGSAHTASLDTTDTLSEAFFFSAKYEETKGKTYSIRLVALSYYLDSVQRQCAVKDLPLPKNFSFLRNNLIAAYEDGIITSNDKLLVFNTLSAFLSALINTGCTNNNQPFILSETDWDIATDILKKYPPSETDELIFFRESLSGHNRTIIVPVSPLAEPYR